MAKNYLQESTDCKNCEQRKDSVFCDLRDSELDVVNNSKSCLLFKKGEDIFVERGNPYGLYCISDGKVKLSKLGNTGKQQIVRLATESDVLGYRALLAEEHYDCTATALTETRVCFIPMKDFNCIMKNNSNLSKSMFKLLAGDVKSAVQLATKIAQKQVKERLAEVILNLKYAVGTEVDGATINLSLSREELANMVGTVTETVIRLLSDLKSDHVIDFVGKKIKIINQSELIRRANIYN
ncbi:Crp/Fnr family transcriptional regulator [Solitalea koreensis]|uniref:CRP/FNR family transcriptional regulator, anaerobic regulatory protein n=1 Tax=Solitalea koreensis TaxID=543615 RepID=A0A521DE90_9SPHI|nr:Crp/Fnr family transcriptional regulator [Solitalea koreensis]SMO69915.1 CRP/FNR family transcriptional regulator, anaerobic regulatory protein [Solitalea koreensis]